MIIHTGVRPFKCKFCDKRFSLKHNMQTHERIHTGEGYECGYCGQIYGQTINLKKHEQKHIQQRHILTDDADIRKRQVTENGRGRPVKNIKLLETLTQKSKKEGKENDRKLPETGYDRVLESISNFDSASAVIDSFISESRDELDDSFDNVDVHKRNIASIIQINTQ